MRDIASLNKVRFTAPLPVGSRLRACMDLQAVEEIEGGAQVAWNVAVECEGSVKPACVAEFLVRMVA